jgi:pimeloyl-ACP methyl ester carboxylesterase
MEQRSADLDGAVAYVDFGGRGRPILLVHGLGGSHANWLSVGARLAPHGRVLAIDLAGHGRTRALGRTAKVGANRALIGRFLAEVVREPAILVGNSMGGYLSIAEAAAEPERVAGLVLVDPALPLAPGARFDLRTTAFFAGVLLPGVGWGMMRRRAHRGPALNVRDTLALCCVDPGRVDPAVVAAHQALAEERRAFGDEVGRSFLEAVRSLTAVLVRRERYFAMVAQVRAPALIVHGARDRLVRLAAAQALAAARPDWRFEVLDDVGHTPQLEVPDRFLAIVEPWLRATGDHRAGAVAGS